MRLMSNCLPGMTMREQYRPIVGTIMFDKSGAYPANAIRSKRKGISSTKYHNVRNNKNNNRNIA